MTERRSAVMWAKYEDEMLKWDDIRAKGSRIHAQQSTRARKDPLPIVVEDPYPTKFYRVVAKDGTVFKCRPTSTLEEAQEKQNGLIVGDPRRWTYSTIQMGEVSAWAIIEGNIDELVEASMGKLKEMADGVV